MIKNRTPILVLLILLFVLGTAIRFFNLGEIFLYRDEPIHSVRIDHQPLPFVVAHNNGSAFFAVLVHFLLDLGPVELMSRLPSAVFGSLSILAIFFLGSYFFSKQTGLMAAALVTFSPFCIQISQYSRGYSLFMFMSLLSFFFFFKAWEEDRISLWFAYVVFTMLALYTHLMGFMILPAYAVFAALQWAFFRIKPGKPQDKTTQTRRILRFTIFTALALFLVFLLYLPDENVRGFLSGSVDRVKTHLPFAYLWSYLVHKIPFNQLQAPGRFFGILLAFGGLGYLSSIKSHGKKFVLLSLYLFLPLAIFIAVNPREVNIQSADRYFIFLLPVLFLLIAQGTTVLVAVASKLLSHIKPRSPRLPALTGILLAVVCFWQIAGFNHRHYYLHFWRLGSFPKAKTSQARLKQEIKEDCLVFFSGFPASGHILVANPLTQDPRVQGSESIIREGWKTDLTESNIMIYRSSGSLKKEIRSQLGVYAVLARGPEHGPGGEYFMQEGAPLSQNLLHLYSELLSKENRPAQRKEYLLRQARVLLLSQQKEAAYQVLAQAHSLKLTPADRLDIPTHPVYSLLDRVFALNEEDLQTAFFETLYNQPLAKILYEQAEEHRQEAQYAAAVRAYQECLRLSETYDLEISNQFTRIANTYLVNEEPEQALPLIREAIRLNPHRQILPLLLAENYRQILDWDSALESLQAFLPTGLLQNQVKDRLQQDIPFILVQRKDSRYRLIFRAPLRTEITGEIVSSKPFKDIFPEFFKRDDVFASSDNRLSWTFKMDKRRIKMLEFTADKGARIELDLKLKGKRIPQHIVLLESGDSPDSLPFFLDTIPSTARK